MPLLLAALSSFAFGVADFVGGFATRRAPAVTVVWGSHLVSLGAVIAVAPLFSDGFGGEAGLWWGAGAGIAGSIGLVVFYHALATTPTAVVAPVAAVVGTGLPVIFGVMVGERPEPVAWLGMALAVPALVLLPSGPRDRRSARRGVLLGVATGIAFALFGILISRTGTESGVWPLASARVASLVLLTLAGPILRRPLVAPRSAWPLIATAALLDMSANVLFLLAVREELLSLVAVIMSLYPAATIALARVVYGEQIAKRQILGLALAAGAMGLIALG
jgi:drug/metabolite transporter (DMT)-like permease